MRPGYDHAPPTMISAVCDSSVAFVQVGAQIDALKKTIEELKDQVKNAKDKQTAAKEDCRKLEKDISEFKNNKEGKTNELKVTPASKFQERSPFLIL